VWYVVTSPTTKPSSFSSKKKGFTKKQKAAVLIILKFIHFSKPIKRKGKRRRKGKEEKK
jgi:hypothetical protein